MTGLIIALIALVYILVVFSRINSFALNNQTVYCAVLASVYAASMIVSGSLLYWVMGL